MTRKTVIYPMLLILLLLACLFTGCSTPVTKENDLEIMRESKTSSSREDEKILIDYILENGEYDAEKDIYSISESITEAGMDFHYSIEYSTTTQKLTFKDTSYISSGFTFTSMEYESGAEQQEVQINMAISSGAIVKSKAVIYPATYTGSNKTIYSFESTYGDERMKTICENSVYQMLIHCQTLMIDAGTGMVPFGFEKGLFK